MPTTEALYASVLIDLRLDRCLDYEIPAALQENLQAGSRVKVSVRGKPCLATVVQVKKTCDFPNPLLIVELLGEKPTVNAELFQLAEWMSRYYLCPLRKALKVLLPPSIRKNTPEKKALFVKPTLTLEELRKYALEIRQKFPAQAEVIDVLLKNREGLFLEELLHQLKTSRSPITSLVKKKIVEVFPVLIDSEEKNQFEYFLTTPKTLNEEQQAALEPIVHQLEKGSFHTFLLFGVTGSGKTEIYLRAIQKALDLGKNVIFLIPEISLASQTLERIKSRFHEVVKIIHHRISEKEKALTWKEISQGKVRIVVGARSAVFSPIQNLGLIIVDEEHEGAYKQTDETPCYNARDVAIMRAKFASATVILGSATPSFESFFNASQNKYSLLTLKTRPSSLHLPAFHIIDMGEEFKKAKGFTLFSDKLLTGIKKRLEVGEQTLLFLNRRGYHSSQMCSKCSYSLRCKHCDVSLTYHLGENVLACHLCDYRLQPPPRTCPSCGSEEGLRFKGAGTEMVEKALHAIFPQVRTLRLDADTTSKKGSHDEILRAFRSGKADVLIGTQMIAKGLHFPALTLAAVLYADAGINLPDFRAAETCFQLLVQVSGRAGRGALPGEIILQTHLVDSPLLRYAAAQDFESFYQEEIVSRKLFQFPPFLRLIKLMVYGKEEKKTKQYGQQLREALIRKLPSTFEIEPLIPCGHARIKDKFRFQFLIKCQNVLSFHTYLEEADRSLYKPSGVERRLDVDPLHTFL